MTKHLKKMSRESIPEMAVPIVVITSKDDCTTNPNVENATACKKAVKRNGVYEMPL